MATEQPKKTGVDIGMLIKLLDGMGTTDDVYRLIKRKKNTGYFKKYYQDNKELIITKQKKYIEDHKDEILARRRIYYKENRDKLLAKRQQLYDEYRATENKKLDDLEQRIILAIQKGMDADKK